MLGAEVWDEARWVLGCSKALVSKCNSDSWQRYEAR